MVAGCEPGHPLADLEHDAGSFMAADGRGHGRQPERAQCLRWWREVAASDVFIGVAQSGRAQLQQHLAGARRVELEFFDGPGVTVPIKDGRAASH